VAIYNAKQRNIAEKFSDDSSLENWRDWKWQLRHSIKDIRTCEELLGTAFSGKEKRLLEHTVRKFPLAITPYYFSLIDPANFRNDPIFKQAFPSPSEMMIGPHDLRDPLAEDVDSPVSLVTHRYPDRVLLQVSNICAMYCRHCTRKRKVGDVDSIPGKEEILAGIAYIRRNEGIRDVLLSGGDPLLLSDSYLEWILSKLRTIPHIEVIRIGTRVPVVLPYRVTESLATMLKKFHPLWINTHFNHPREMTTSAKEAVRRLADAGIPLGNQSVLLAGVNDCPRIMKKLVHVLVKNRIRPYYMYQCDLSEGLTHFRTPVGKGIEIMENLIGHTSGFAVPTYVIDAPHGGGKIPVMPNYLISWSTNKVVLRNFEGVISTYKEPDSYEPVFCDRNCTECRLSLDLEEGQERPSVGISRLLGDDNSEDSLVPENNERLERRKHD
jgi:lysine 2,3-aminomutase